MNGLALNIQRCYAGRGQDSDFLASVAAEIIQKRGFAGAGPSCNENTFGGVFNDVKGFFKLIVDFDFWQAVRVQHFMLNIRVCLIKVKDKKTTQTAIYAARVLG